MCTVISTQIMTNHEGNMKINLDRGIQEGLETMSVKLGGYSIFDIGCSTVPLKLGLKNVVESNTGVLRVIQVFEGQIISLYHPGNHVITDNISIKNQTSVSVLQGLGVKRSKAQNHMFFNVCICYITRSVSIHLTTLQGVSHVTPNRFPKPSHKYSLCDQYLPLLLTLNGF